MRNRADVANNMRHAGGWGFWGSLDASQSSIKFQNPATVYSPSLQLEQACLKAWVSIDLDITNIFLENGESTDKQKVIERRN